MSTRQLSLFDAPATPRARGEAIWSHDRRYRYLLSWPVPSAFHTPRLAVMVGLNPSTADENKLDPTLTRFAGFCQRWGCTRMVVLNLFALVSTDPKGMSDVADPVGPDNDETIRMTLEHDVTPDTVVVAAWGAHTTAATRAAAVMALVPGVRWQCFGSNHDGSPKHPLYLPATSELVAYEPRVLPLPPPGDPTQADRPSRLVGTVAP